MSSNLRVNVVSAVTQQMEATESLRDWTVTMLYPLSLQILQRAIEKQTKLTAALHKAIASL